MKPRVLLLSPPGDRLYIRDQYCSLSSKANYCWGPTDLVVLSGILDAHAELRAIDATVLGMGHRECAELVLSARPDVLVFLTGHCSIENDLAFVEAIRKELPLLTVASGNICLEESGALLERYPSIDALILDFTSAGIVEYIKKGRRATSRVPGIRYRSANGCIVEAEPSAADKTFTIPVPRHDLFPLDKYRLPYLRNRGFATVLTNMGCPYRCTFCVAGTLPFKYRPVQNVLEELRYVRSLGVREVFFKDSLFGANRKNTMDLCEAMIDEKLDFSWSCSCRVDTIDEELLTLMRCAGCYFIAMGVESGNPEVLARAGKGITLERAVEAFGLCRRLGIGTSGFFIIGLPGETKRTARETIRLALKLDPDFASFAVASPDYGTELRRQVVRTAHDEQLARESDRSKTAFASCEAMTPPEIESWQRRAVRAFYLRPSFILKCLRRVRTLAQLRRLVAGGLALIRNYVVRC